MIDLPKFRAIGVLGRECPYCGVEFEKRPGKQKQCPACKNVVHVRLRPLDEKWVLVTKAQVEDIYVDRRLRDAIRWRERLILSLHAGKIEECIYWLKSLSAKVLSINMPEESVRLAIAALALEGGAGLRDCCAAIHSAQKYHGYKSSGLSKNFDQARTMISRELSFDQDWAGLKDQLSTAYLELLYRTSDAKQEKARPPAPPARRIRGVLREYSVHAATDITDDVCETIIQVLEEHGKLPYRNVTQPGVDGILLALDIGAWSITMNDGTFEVAAFEDMIIVSRVTAG